MYTNSVDAGSVEVIWICRKQAMQRLLGLSYAALNNLHDSGPAAAGIMGWG